MKGREGQADFVFQTLLMLRDALEWAPLADFDGKIKLNRRTGRLLKVDGTPVTTLTFDYIGVRHGRTPTNRPGFFQGQSDLTPENQLSTHSSDGEPTGEQQARLAAERLYEQLKEKLRNPNNVVILSSPLGRARRTAEIFVEYVREQTHGAVQLEIQIEPPATEIDFGDIDTKSPEVHSEEEVAKAIQYRALNATTRFRKADGESESFLDLSETASRAFAESGTPLWRF